MNAGITEYQKGQELENKGQYAEAYAYYQKAANLGNYEACNKVGDCYFFGRGTDKNDKNAFAWYYKAASNGNAEGQGNLGYCYSNGVGVAKDYVKAVEWFQKAADQGDAGAMVNLGNRYLQGEGVKADPIAAMNWFISSAEKGNANGCFMVGLMLYDGNMGVKQDYARAFAIFTECISITNHRQAQYYLGEMSLFGKGVKQNYKQAKTCLSLSGFQGYPQAIELLEQYSEKLFNMQLTAAFYNWLMEQNVKCTDFKQAPDFQMFMTARNCIERGMDYYTMMGFLSQRLIQIASQNFNLDQVKQIDFFKLSKNWMTGIKK